MKKRLFSVLLATAMVASMATGATCTTVSAAEKKTIKFFHRFPDEPFNSFIEDKIAQYEGFQNQEPKHLNILKYS